MTHVIGHGKQRLAAEDAGEGPTFVGLHGLTATRRYVLMGSRLLERSGRRVVLYDARGHGASSPPFDGDYSYSALAGDLEAVIDSLGVDRVVLLGASMGAHTAIRVALEHPARVAALALVTPGYDPDRFPGDLAHWDALAGGLREQGIAGFIAAYALDRVPVGWRDTIERVIRQRLAAHEHLGAVADALEAVPRSRPFDGWDALAAIDVPTVVVGSRDEADPGHPLALAEAYAEAIPAARLLVEEEGRSPIAWQGSQLSRLLLDF